MAGTPAPERKPGPFRTGTSAGHPAATGHGPGSSLSGRYRRRSLRSCCRAAVPERPSSGQRSPKPPDGCCGVTHATPRTTCPVTARPPQQAGTSEARSAHRRTGPRTCEECGSHRRRVQCDGPHTRVIVRFPFSHGRTHEEQWWQDGLVIVVGECDRIAVVLAGKRFECDGKPVRRSRQAGCSTNGATGCSAAWPGVLTECRTHATAALAAPSSRTASPVRVTHTVVTCRCLPPANLAPSRRRARAPARKDPGTGKQRARPEEVGVNTRLRLR